MHRAEKLFDCPHVLKSCLNAYVLSSLEYWISVWMSSVESHLGLLDSIVSSAEMSCEDEHCYLAHRRKVTALCLLYEIYRRVDHPINGYLNYFVAVLNSRPFSATRQLAFVIPCCRIDHFSWSFLPDAVRLWILLPSGVFSGCTLNFLRALWTYVYWGPRLIFYTFISVSVCCFIACSVSWFWARSSL